MGKQIFAKVSMHNEKIGDYIYLDNNATTCLSEGVKEIIKESLGYFHNPSSKYRPAEAVKRKITAARNQVAKLIKADAEQILFTSGATESNNTVIHSCVMANYKNKKKNIVISAVEHSAMIETAKYYEKYHNTEVRYIKVDSMGRIDVKDVIKLVDKNTALVSVMLANNEIGNIYPVKEICKEVKKKNPNTVVHTDATQAIGKMDVDVKGLGVDYLSLSGHKFHAPKGVGALYVKSFDNFVPFLYGGHQEEERRAGTENVISIIAMGEAAKEAMENPAYDKIRQLRDKLETALKKKVLGLEILGDTENRVCNTICALIKGKDGVTLGASISGRLAFVSSGSACNTKVAGPSHVMQAMGINEIPVRISLSKYTTEEEIESFIKVMLVAIAEYNRRNS